MDGLTSRILVGLLGSVLALGGAAPSSARGSCTPSWTVVPAANPIGGRINDLAAASPSDVWAVGYQGRFENTRTLIERWDGNAWTVVPSPNVGAGNELDSVAALSATNVWAVGYSNNYGLPYRPRRLIEHWDGRRWRIVPSPGHGMLSAVGGAAADDVWAVGVFRDDNAAEKPRTALILHWHRGTWSEVKSPAPHAEYAPGLDGLAVVSPKDVWAVGGAGTDRPFAEHWDGNRWLVKSAPRLSSEPNEVCENALIDVSAVSAYDVWAVGYCAAGPSTEHWNGRKWKRIRVPDEDWASHYDNQEDSKLFSVAALSASDVWAVGFGIEHWDGQRWRPAGPDGEEPYAIVAASLHELWASAGLGRSYDKAHFLHYTCL
jgi:hypothetical protein